MYAKQKVYALYSASENWPSISRTKLGYRAKIILLRNEGYTVPEIRRKTNRDGVTGLSSFQVKRY